MNRMIGLLMALCLVAPSVFANDKDDNYRAIYPEDSGSCGSFNDAVSEGKIQGVWINWNKFSSYTMGFLTALNFSLPDTFDLTADKGQSAYMGWLEKYCAENPLADFVGALFELTEELYPTRTVTAPK